MLRAFNLMMLFGIRFIFDPSQTFFLKDLHYAVQRTVLGVNNLDNCVITKMNLESIVQGERLLCFGL